MSIRNSLFLALPFLFFATLFSSEEKKEWKLFKRSHDLFLLIKNVNKNESRVVKFRFKDLEEEEYSVNWIEREDFLPKDTPWTVDEKTIKCHCYNQKVGAEGERQTMLTVELPQPVKKQYRFIMHDYYECVAVAAVPNGFVEEKPATDHKPTAKEKAQHYFGKLKHNIALAWSKLSGKKS